MDTIPAQLTAIRRDWRRLNLRQVPVVQLGPAAIRNLLVHLSSLKARLTRCRRVISAQARSLRARLLRSLFLGWRTVLRKAVQVPHLQGIAVEHVLNQAHATHLFDTNNWVPRILATDPALFRGLIPQINISAPHSAQGHIRDPFWRALRANLSVARL